MSVTKAHISEDELERYSLGTLADDEAVRLEEHLLWCETCQDRLEEADEFVQAFRVAAARLAGRPAEEKRPPGRLRSLVSWNWRPLPAAGALACAALAVVVFYPRSPVATGTTEVSLVATRDAEGGSASVPAGRTLVLNLDLAGVAEEPLYFVELVDRAGKPVWSTVVERRAGSRLTVRPPNALGAGRYWVRIHESSPERPLLREFGVQIH